MSELTPKAVAYLGMEEGLVREAYKDSVGVWTWALGVTDASGHLVQRYKDNPQPLEKCLEVSIWLLKEEYLPAVIRAFKKPLTENELAAALSFHWNTGAISRAQWVKDWNTGNKQLAYNTIMSWSSKGLLTKRRDRERQIFFNGIYPKDMRVNVYPVSHETYHPIIGKAERIDLLPYLSKLL